MKKIDRAVRADRRRGQVISLGNGARGAETGALVTGGGVIWPAGQDLAGWAQAGHSCVVGIGRDHERRAIPSDERRRRDFAGPFDPHAFRSRPDPKATGVAGESLAVRLEDERSSLPVDRGH